MTNTVIDATQMFLGKRMLDILDKALNETVERYRPFYLTYENEGVLYLELCLRDTEDDSIIVVDNAPMERYVERLQENKPLFTFL